MTAALAAFLGLWWVVGGPSVDERLLPAWEALGALRGREGTPIGEQYRERAAGTVSVILAGKLPPGVEDSGVGELGWIVVADRLLGEDPKVIAAYLVHELAHAEQDRGASERPDSGYGRTLPRDWPANSHRSAHSSAL